MNATRRNFFLKAGTALSFPLAAGGSDARPDEPDAAASIRRMQQKLARAINDATGRAAALFASGKLPAELAAVTRLQPADFGEYDAIETAADGQSARATLHCLVETRVPIAAESTLIEMARAQGEGFIRSTDRKMLELIYVRHAGTWKIKTLAMREP
jgi:hypothetical protein